MVYILSSQVVNPVTVRRRDDAQSARSSSGETNERLDTHRATLGKSPLVRDSCAQCPSVRPSDR